MNWIESLFKIAGEVFRMIGEAINENKNQVIAKLAMLVRNHELKQKQNCAQHDFNDENGYRAVLGALK